jgi:hypothetical protein
LAAQDGDLVAKDDDLDGKVLSLTLRETHQLEHADEGKVEEGERHASSSSRRSRQRKSRPQVRMTFSAPTGWVPLATNQVSVPTLQGLGLDEEPASELTIE